MITKTKGRDGNGAKRLTFSLSATEPLGRVSVVGTFNDWDPGRHVLILRSNGRR